MLRQMQNSPMPSAHLKWFLVAFALIATACSTPEHKRWDRIQPGMEKFDVLESAGNPQVTRRVHNQDWWTYHKYGEPTPREVHFEEGRVIYSGPPVKSKVSAEEQDKINEISNKQADEEYESSLKARDAELGIARPKSYSNGGSAKPASLEDEELDAKLRSQLYGTPMDPKFERRKVAPVFEPVN